MKQTKTIRIFTIILTAITLAVIITINCRMTDTAFADTDKTSSYVFYTKDGIDYRSSEPLSVFIDHNGCFHIFELKTRTHYSTISRSKFISELSKICSKKYYSRIAYLTINKKANRYAAINDIITDTTLVQITGYPKENGHSFKNVRSVEYPNPELRFCFGNDFILP